MLWWREFTIRIGPTCFAFECSSSSVMLPTFIYTTLDGKRCISVGRKPHTAERAIKVDLFSIPEVSMAQDRYRHLKTFVLYGMAMACGTKTYICTELKFVNADLLDELLFGYQYDLLKDVVDAFRFKPRVLFY